MKEKCKFQITAKFKLSKEEIKTLEKLAKLLPKLDIQFEITENSPGIDEG
jgi:hypothetical protein